MYRSHCDIKCAFHFNPIKDILPSIAIEMFLTIFPTQHICHNLLCKIEDFIFQLGFHAQASL